MSAPRAQKLVRIILFAGAVLAIGFVFMLGTVSAWGETSGLAFARGWYAIVRWASASPFQIGAIAYAAIASVACGWCRRSSLAAAVAVGLLGVATIGAGAFAWHFLVVAEDPHYPGRGDHVAAIGLLLGLCVGYGGALVVAATAWAVTGPGASRSSRASGPGRTA